MPEHRPSLAQPHTFMGCGVIWGAAVGFAGNTRNQGCVVARGVMCCDMRNLTTVAESSRSYATPLGCGPKALGATLIVKMKYSCDGFLIHVGGIS